MEFAEQAAAPGSNPDGAAMIFICKVLRLNYGKLTDDEKEWFKKIAEKSDLLKNPNRERGRKPFVVANCLCNLDSFLSYFFIVFGFPYFLPSDVMHKSFIPKSFIPKSFIPKSFIPKSRPIF